MISLTVEERGEAVCDNGAGYERGIHGLIDRGFVFRRRGIREIVFG